MTDSAINARIEHKAVSHPPYSLSIDAAAKHFGFAPKTLYNWISQGRLARGQEYLIIGRKPVIIRDRFIEWMEREDGSNVCSN